MTLTAEEINIIDLRLDYFFENNEYIENIEVLTSFVMESELISFNKIELVKQFIQAQITSNFNEN